MIASPSSQSSKFLDADRLWLDNSMFTSNSSKLFETLKLYNLETLLFATLFRHSAHSPLHGPRKQLIQLDRNVHGPGDNHFPFPL